MSTSDQEITPEPALRSGYPGLGLPLWQNENHEDPCFPLGAHTYGAGSTSKPLPVRELAMMSVLDTLTDKPNWHKKVFVENIVAKWRKEAMAIPNEEFWSLATSSKKQEWDDDGNVEFSESRTTAPVTEDLLSATTFDCCIEELRSKAKFFERTGITPTLDAYATVAKSDSLVSEDLRALLLNAFQTLQADQNESPDWHPQSNEMVQNLVHPSMYPLVYRQSRVFKEEVVGVEDAITKWAGKGDVIPGEEEWNGTELDKEHYLEGSLSAVPPEYWSVHYQWLPSNILFKADSTVRFTSYINNLHPTKYSSIYRTLERLIEASLPMWDQCLTLYSNYGELDGAGRTESRFAQHNQSDENPDNWTPKLEECQDVEVDKKDLEYQGLCPEDDAETVAQYKWEILRTPVLPEPQFETIDYTPAPGKRLINRFRDSGLQIIVKMASIELTPEKPRFPVGNWHVEGQMNEHICATALYYLSSENVTPSRLFFRVQTDYELQALDDRFDVGQEQYQWMQSFYGTDLCAGGGPCLQNYGSVETREGRLLAFPNVFQHRVSPFELADPTKPGHRRFIALWLVDPHKRIISTANVPPQQRSWWTESVLGASDRGRTETLSKLPADIIDLLPVENVDAASAASGEEKLPLELKEMVREYYSDSGAGLMSRGEAEEHRARLMQERSAYEKASEDEWQKHSYSFCEH